MRIFYVHGKGTTGVGRPSHRRGSIGVIEREVSALNLFQIPRPASPERIFQNGKVIRIRKQSIGTSENGLFSFFRGERSYLSPVTLSQPF